MAEQTIKYNNDINDDYSKEALDILVANNQLIQTGGTENYTFAIIEELLRLGHDVEYFTFHKGEISDRIEALEVSFKSKEKYDLIIANHKTVIEELIGYGYLIQTCHGRLSILEQPSQYADFHVSVSNGIQKHLLTAGIKSSIIHNGVNCKRFFPVNKINNELKSVLSLCHSETANRLIKECCDEINIQFKKINKNIENIWEIENAINEVDLVIGIGRSLYDSMACGRAVISYDQRYYSDYSGDGYLNKENVVQSLQYNCCGRASNKKFNKQEFIDEINKYKSSDGEYLREFALSELNIEKSVQKYLQLYFKHRDTHNPLIKSLLLIKDKRIQELEDTINNLEENIISKEKELSGLQSSKSWRITSPLRKIVKILRKIQNWALTVAHKA